MFLRLVFFNLFVFVVSWYPYDFVVPGEHKYHGVHDGTEHVKNYVNEWTVEVDGGEEVAQLVALELGYVYGGLVEGFPNTYVFRKYEHVKQRRTPSLHRTSTLVQDRRVRWAEQLFLKSRVKRYASSGPDESLNRVKRIESNNTILVEKRNGPHPKQQFNDELWSHQWYLQGTRTSLKLPRLDLNVLPVYKLGFTGRGVRVSVLDDGIEHNHTDLRNNYDPEISWDCNDRDSDPSPRYHPASKNSHGTRCAGEIAMTANNQKCGVGVAWGAKVGGVRMLDGAITDRIEGEAIGYAADKVDIYSVSWGPNDDGRTVEGPGRLALKAFQKGVEKGRDGKGAIYVWANGNGGGNHDNCNCDGYSSSIYTVSIGSASQQGIFPWYGEICSSTLATAYSSGAYKDQKIVTSDIRDSCTMSHTGTSAAAPLAAGIIALALEANPNLTWRDVQHLIVWTSEYAPLSANPGWQANGVGLRFDIRFGFGLINAEGLVTTALNWTNVPKKTICRVTAIPLDDEEAIITTGKEINIIIDVKNCAVNYLEHVELVSNIKYTRRGALQVSLISPRGTKIQLLSPRPNDFSDEGFYNWPLTSVGTWGENPSGNWKIIIEDKTDEHNTGKIGTFILKLHGTNQMPAHMRNGSRRYKNEYDYQEILDYFDNIQNNDLNSVSDDVTEALRELRDTKEIDMNDVDSEILVAVEKELQRVHHRKNYLADA